MTDKLRAHQNLIEAALPLGDMIADHAETPADAARMVHTALCRWAALRGLSEQAHDDAVAEVCDRLASHGDP